MCYSRMLDSSTVNSRMLSSSMLSSSMLIMPACTALPFSSLHGCVWEQSSNSYGNYLLTEGLMRVDAS